jgi:hypothetical protein
MFLRNRLLQMGFAGIVVLVVVSCSSPRNDTPAQIIQPKPADLVLLERGTQAFTGKKYLVAVTLLETLNNTYPASTYVQQSEQMLKDCSRLEECAPALKQANGGGMTFFPNLSGKQPPDKPGVPLGQK